MCRKGGSLLAKCCIPAVLEALDQAWFGSQTGQASFFPTASYGAPPNRGLVLFVIDWPTPKPYLNLRCKFLFRERLEFECLMSQETQVLSQSPGKGRREFQRHGLLDISLLDPLQVGAGQRDPLGLPQRGSLTLTWEWAAGGSPWGSSPLGLQLFGILALWNSSPLGFQPFGVPILWDSNSLGFQPFGVPALWGSSSLGCQIFKVPALWDSNSLGFQPFGIPNLWHSSSLVFQLFGSVWSSAVTQGQPQRAAVHREVSPVTSSSSFHPSPLPPTFVCSFCFR